MKKFLGSFSVAFGLLLIGGGASPFPQQGGGGESTLPSLCPDNTQGGCNNLGCPELVRFCNKLKWLNPPTCSCNNGIQPPE